MKVKKLANQYLKKMFKSYYSNAQRIFTIDYFKAISPEIDESIITDALVTLKEDGLVSIFFADNVAYSTTLNPQALIQKEEDTWVKKGYHVVKEILSWINP